MPNTWKASLPRRLQNPRSESGEDPRVAVLGVGNLLRSDDAAGVLAARALSRRAAQADRLLIVEAGQAPESQTARLRSFAPSVVLLVDAADMGREPGCVAWISEDEIDGMSASTHSLPLSMLAKFLTLDLGCPVHLLGIQAASNEVGETVCAEVLRAVEEVAAGLEEAIRSVRVCDPANP